MAVQTIVSSSVETEEENFCISKQPCNVLFYLCNKCQLNTKPFHFNNFFCERHD